MTDLDDGKVRAMDEDGFFITEAEFLERNNATDSRNRIRFGARREHTLCRNGATILRSYTGAIAEFGNAPTDERELAELQLSFERVKLELTERDRDALEEAIRQRRTPAKWQVNAYGPVPSPGGPLAALKHLVALCAEHQAAIDEIESRAVMVAKRQAAERSRRAVEDAEAQEMERNMKLDAERLRWTPLFGQKIALP